MHRVLATLLLYVVVFVLGSPRASVVRFNSERAGCE